MNQEEIKVEHILKVVIFERKSIKEAFTINGSCYGVGEMPKEIFDDTKFIENSDFDDCFCDIWTETDEIIYPSYDEICDTFVHNHGFSVNNEEWDEIYNLPIGGWYEKNNLNDLKKIHFERIAILPKISRELTIKNSELSHSAQAVIKLYGIPLLREGELVDASNVYMPNIDKLRNEIWEHYIISKSNLKEVKVVCNEIPHADNEVIEMKITATSAEDIVIALKTIGCVNAETISLKSCKSDGKEITMASASLRLKKHIDL